MWTIRLKSTYNMSKIIVTFVPLKNYYSAINKLKLYEATCYLTSWQSGAGYNGQG